MTGTERTPSSASAKPGLRIAYVKGGDVVASLDKIQQAGPSLSPSSPLAFQAAMMQLVGKQPLFLLSIAHRTSQRRSGSITAITVQEGIPRFGRLGLAYVRWRTKRQVCRELETFRPDCIVCGCLGYVLTACQEVANRLQIPLVASVHNGITSEADMDRLKQLPAVLCHGPYLKKLLLESGLAAEKLLVFELPMAVPRFAGANSQQPIILYTGRIERTKGVFDLLEAAVELLGRDSSARLIYVGDGPDWTALRQHIRARGLEKQVQLTGNVTHEEVFRYVRSSKVLVTPTQSVFPEGRCMAAAEALVCGIPVIAPNFGPFPFLVEDHQNGLLFEPDSVTNLRTKLERVWSDQQLYEKLATGAHQTGQELLANPELDFEAALRAALARVGCLVSSTNSPS